MVNFIYYVLFNCIDGSYFECCWFDSTQADPHRLEQCAAGVARECSDNHADRMQNHGFHNHRDHQRHRHGFTLEFDRIGHRQKKSLTQLWLLVPANRAGPVRPESSSLFLLTSPGHNSNNQSWVNFFFCRCPIVEDDCRRLLSVMPTCALAAPRRQSARRGVAPIPIARSRRLWQSSPPNELEENWNLVALHSSRQFSGSALISPRPCILENLKLQCVFQE